MSLKTSENQNVEFKEVWKDDYLKWISGFANAQGGKIYIGCDDNGNVVGIENSKRLLEDIPNKITQNLGLVLDVNSLYPSVMKNAYLPFGKPIYFSGKYEESYLYPLYIQRIACSFELKEGKIPTIQLKNNPSYNPTEYLTSSNGEIIDLTLTNVDLKLFFEHYNVDNLYYDGGWKFKQVRGLFNNYIDLLLDDVSVKPLKIISKAIYNICKQGKDPYNEIKDELKKSKHKVVVFIDDVDRLDADEIKEVLRLIIRADLQWKRTKRRR